MRRQVLSGWETAEGLSKKEKTLMDLDNSEVILVGGGQVDGDEGCTGDKC